MKQQHREADSSGREECSQTSDSKPPCRSAPPREFTVPKASNDGKAPPLDEELLRALVRQELPEGQRRDVYLLIHSFKDWDDAHARILIEEYHKNRTKEASDGD